MFWPAMLESELEIEFAWRGVPLDNWNVRSALREAGAPGRRLPQERAHFAGLCSP